MRSLRRLSSRASTDIYAESIMTDQRVEGVPTLVLANKQDVEGSVPVGEIMEMFNKLIVDKLNVSEGAVLPISALKGCVVHWWQRAHELTPTLGRGFGKQSTGCSFGFKSEFSPWPQSYCTDEPFRSARGKERPVGGRANRREGGLRTTRGGWGHFASTIYDYGECRAVVNLMPRCKGSQREKRSTRTIANESGDFADLGPAGLHRTSPS